MMHRVAVGVCTQYDSRDPLLYYIVPVPAVVDITTGVEVPTIRYYYSRSDDGGAELVQARSMEVMNDTGTVVVMVIVIQKCRQ